jgi:hypothetical protein
MSPSSEPAAVINPFVPTFGVEPPVLIGRGDALIDVRDGIAEGTGSPLRANKFIGPRGIGKTVLLEAAADVAREQGWIPISVTASPDMLDEILDLALDETKHLRDAPHRKISGIKFSGTGIDLTNPEVERVSGWRVQMRRILDLVEAHETGLFFTMDEVSARHEALAAFGKQFQHFRREGREVAFAAAGLPLNVEEFEKLSDTTFMRRAIPHNLGDVSVAAVRDALFQTFTASGRTIDLKALRRAAEATEGYPFLVQLVGYQSWREASGKHITWDEVERGIAIAKRRVGDTVHTSAMADLSPVDKTFLIKMTLDDGPSKMADITARGGWSREQSNVYRSRLITAGMIRPAGHGLVEFAFPYLREFLREHASTIVWS